MLRISLTFLFLMETLLFSLYSCKTPERSSVWPALPLMRQLVVSFTFCDHRCVFMRVSSWWRAVSVQGVCAGGNCDPSLDGAVTQVPEHSFVQSSLLLTFFLITESLRKSLQITNAWESPAPVRSRSMKNQHAFELEGKNIHRQFEISQQSVFNKWKCGVNQAEQIGN